MSGEKPEIFCYVVGKFGGGPDVTVCALSEDGELLAAHVSSSVSWAKHDIGFTWLGSPHRQKYHEHYPDGYELVWVEGSIRDHPVGGAALDRNHDKYPKKEASTVESQS